MIIVSATDQNFAELAGVMLKSIALNGNVPEARVYLLTDGVDAQTLELLQRCAEGLNFHAVPIEPLRQEIADLPVFQYATATYARLLIPRLIPGGGRVLYMDSDVVVRQSLRPLFDMDMGDCLVAAVLPYNPNPNRFGPKNIRLGRPEDAPYFSAGVIIFDNDVWRREKVGERCIAYAQENTKVISWADQDALNVVLEGRVKPISGRWNHMGRHRDPIDLEDAAIVHFVGVKPNKPECRHQGRALYKKIRRQTPFAVQPTPRARPPRKRSAFVRFRDFITGRTYRRRRASRRVAGI
jgi:lipopolysaccharide biosynthesis glycosyltransferase